MGRFGGSRIRDILEKQRTEIDNYYGSINELKLGVISPEKVPPMPDIMRAVEFVKSTGLPLVAGGVMDQPHIWLLQLEMVETKKLEWAIINAAADVQGN